MEQKKWKELTELMRDLRPLRAGSPTAAPNTSATAAPNTSVAGSPTAALSLPSRGPPPPPYSGSS